MKKQNKKWLTLMLASLCAVSLGASIVSATVQADETEPVSEASTYGITDVFASNGTAGADGTNVAFTLGNEKYARIKRDLAFKWYEAKGTASYLNIEFAFDKPPTALPSSLRQLRFQAWFHARKCRNRLRRRCWYQ